jgi:type I restriction enzyme M protein
MSDLKTEEDVKVKFLLPYLKDQGYKIDCCEFEKSIEVHEGRKQKKIFADIVIYTSPSKNAPIILCETKHPNEILNRSVKEQAISYARLLPKIAPLVLITNGSQVQVYQTLSKNRISQLPHRKELHSDLMDFIISKEIQEALRAEAKHELFIIDDVKTFKNILKSCHNEIRNNEGYDPTIAFDEMSKVLFCKLYEEKRSNHDRFKLSIFDETLKGLGVNVVKQIFKETKKDEKYSDLFDENTQINLVDRTIRKIVSLFQNYDLSLTAFDVKGEAFEYFLGDTFTGGLGEYFTPRNIVEFIVDAINPKIGDKIIDPFCGTGGFLIYAFEIVSEKIRLQEFSEQEKNRWKFELSNKSLFGTDWKERTSQACKMNMMVHGDGSTGIFMHHGLVDVEGYIEEGIFDICITNPPFGSIENDPDILKNYELGGGRKTQERVILAIERAIRLTKPNGVIGIVVIQGVLNNLSRKYVRDYIKRNTWIMGVIGLAEETFQGYGSEAKTSILLLKKKETPDEGEQKPVFMAIAKNTGYAPNGLQIPGNELPDILLDYKAFLRNEKEAGNHLNVWICKVEERLDPEFYGRYTSDMEITDIHTIQEDTFMLLTQINTEYSQLDKAIHEAVSVQDFKLVRIDDLIEEVQEKEEVQSSKDYKLLGVRIKGYGAYIREKKSGRDIKAKNLYKVSSGWFIYSRLFARVGAFAILGNEHDGCYVSNEFPTFVVKDGIENPIEVSKYIVYCLTSPQYLKIIDPQTTGSTKKSRGRFSQKQLLNLTIKIPKSPEEVRSLIDLMDKANTLRSNQQFLLESMKDLRDGLAQLIPY